MKNITTLEATLKNDIRGIIIEESDWAEGFIIRDFSTGKAMYTAYVGENGFSSYVCIPDGTGYEFADEKQLAENVSVFSAVSAIKSHQIRNGSEEYRLAEDRPDADFCGIDCWRY